MNVVIKTKYMVDTDRLTKAAKEELVGQPDHSLVQVTITDNKTLADLNKKYRDKEGPTPVLSFSQLEPTRVTFPSIPTEQKYLGDVIIAYPLSLDLSKERGETISETLEMLVRHGANKLIGNK